MTKSYVELQAGLEPLLCRRAAAVTGSAAAGQGVEAARSSHPREQVHNAGWSTAPDRKSKGSSA